MRTRKILRNKVPQFSKHLSEPWFTHIKNGTKTAEGRLNNGVFAQMQVGDVVEWYNNSNKQIKKCLTRITHINHYRTFYDMIRAERLMHTLPERNIRTIQQGVDDVYYKYYSPEDEKKYGVVAIQIEVI